MKKYVSSKSLGLVRSYFPKVKWLKDATKPLMLEVTNVDSDNADVKTHKTCALAVCAKRTTRADGVIVGLTRSYIVHGEVATRYDNGNAIGRELTAFDRKAGFANGTYQLGVITESRRFGVPRKKRPMSPRTGNKDRRRFRHVTSGVRTVIGRKEEVL